MLKALKWAGYGFVLLLALLVGLLTFVATTQAGLQWAWSIAKPYLPEAIEVASIEGRLIGPLSIHGLSVQTESMHLQLAHFRLRWDAAALLNAVVYIREIHLEGLTYTARSGGQQQPDTGEPFELPQAIDLPVDVVVQSFTLANARIRTAPDAQPIVVDRAHLTATLDDQAWRIRHLTASGPHFQLNGHARLVPRGNYPHSVRLEWRVALPDLAPIEGHATLHGDLSRTQAELELAAPYNLQAQATIRHPLDSLAVKADVQLDHARLTAIRKDLPPVTISAQAEIAGTLRELAFNLDLTATHAKRGTANLALAGRYTGEAVHIETLTLTSPGMPGRLTAHGDIALAAGHRMDFVLTWQHLQWPLQGPAKIVSPSGRFTVRGPLTQYHVDGHMRWRLTEQNQKGRLTLSGTGSLKAFELERFVFKAAPGKLTGHARIAWAPRLEVTAQLAGQHLNPGAVLPDWPGDLALSLELQAAQQQNGLHVQLEHLHVDGTLRGHPLHVDAVARYSPAGAVIDKLHVVAGATTLRVSGRVTPPMDFRFSLHSDDLSTTVPGAEGSIAASGHISGTYARPNIVAEIDAQGLAYRGNRIGQLELDADIHLSGQQQSSFKLTVRDARFGAIAVRRVRIQGSGTLDDHRLSLELDSSEGHMALALTGDFNQDKGVWRFRLQQARLAYRDLPAWRLVGTAAGRVTATTQRLQKACFVSESARLCLQGVHDSDGSRARFSLEDFRFAYLQPLMPEDLYLIGAVSAHGRIRVPAGGAPRARLVVTTSEGRLMAVNPRGNKVKVLSFEPGRIEARLAASGRIEMHVTLPLANGGIRMHATVHGGRAPLVKRPVTAELRLNLESLVFLSELVPEVTRVNGTVHGHYRLTGTLAAPEIDGRLVLKASTLGLATPGLTIHDLKFAVIGAGRNIDIRASARSGGGYLKVRGHIAPSRDGTTVVVHIRGEHFRVLDNRMGRVYASPDLTVKISQKRIEVTGKLHIPEAMITPQELPAGSGAVTVSEDQIIMHPGRDQIAKAAMGGRELYAHIRLTVGDPGLHLGAFAQRGRNYVETVRRLPDNLVRFHGFGLKAVLVGELLIVQAPDHPTTASGELRIVVGQYQAYGQSLRIKNSSILFAGGPITQPTLDIRAVRTPREDILVGVHVTGTLKDPKLTLFSRPAGMTQSEILSWLILGRPLSETSGAKSSLISKVALAIGLKGGALVTETLRSQLNLDYIGLESSGSGRKVSLVVGEYLTPKLYVSYGIGLFSPVQTLRLRYTLSKLWHLETQSTGTSTGGDLIFSIELP